MIKESEKNAKKFFFLFFFPILSFKSHPEQTMQEKRFCFFLPNILFSFSFFLLKRYRLKAKITNNVTFFSSSLFS